MITLLKKIQEVNMLDEYKYLYHMVYTVYTFHCGVHGSLLFIMAAVTADTRDLLGFHIKINPSRDL